jgi:hypothetical protein
MGLSEIHMILLGSLGPGPMYRLNPPLIGSAYWVLYCRTTVISNGEYTKNQAYWILTIFVHLNYKTFLETTGLTLISPGYVYDAISIFFTDVVETSSYTPLEKTTTTITAHHPIVLTGSLVTTHVTKWLGFPV